MATALVEDRLKSLPPTPGVYLMKDASGTVLYVGKAVSLRNRVRSYFQPSAKPHGPNIRALLQHVADLEYVLTDNEVEALLLENNLIKEHQPRYNVKLKDDKRYPYLCVTVQESFPRLFLTRNVERNGARYFGPFSHARATRETLKQITRIFPIRTCTLDLAGEGNQHRVCLDYHIGHCPGPCADLVSQKEYAEITKQVLLFLGGRTDLVAKHLEAQMQQHAQDLNFEAAAKVRDQLAAVEQVGEKQKVDSGRQDDQDVLGYALREDEACVQILMFRNGKLLDREHFFLADAVGKEPGEILGAFAQQYYADASFVPPQILLQHALEMQEAYADWLSQKRGGKVVFHVPQKGQKRQLIDMAARNALNILEQKQVQMVVKATDDPALTGLRDALELASLPQRIEAFDISTLFGTHMVASMVVFEEGKAAKSEYRRFRIRDVEVQDDYGAMREVIHRRYGRVLRENEMWPDVILIDGGKGQLGAALEALEALGVGVTADFRAQGFAVIGLAKQQEFIFRPGISEPLILERNHVALHLVQRVRDEAHRFAVSYHRKLREKKMTHSVLDEIPGLGPKRRQALIQHFGSVERIREAGLDELLAVKNMSRSVASAIRKHLSVT